MENSFRQLESMLRKEAGIGWKPCTLDWWLEKVTNLNHRPLRVRKASWAKVSAEHSHKVITPALLSHGAPCHPTPRGNLAPPDVALKVWQAERAARQLEGGRGGIGGRGERVVGQMILMLKPEREIRKGEPLWEIGKVTATSGHTVWAKRYPGTGTREVALKYTKPFQPQEEAGDGPANWAEALAQVQAEAEAEAQEPADEEQGEVEPAPNEEYSQTWEMHAAFPGQVFEPAPPGSSPPAADHIVGITVDPAPGRAEPGPEEQATAPSLRAPTRQHRSGNTYPVQGLNHLVVRHPGDVIVDSGCHDISVMGLTQWEQLGHTADTLEPPHRYTAIKGVGGAQPILGTGTVPCQIGSGGTLSFAVVDGSLGPLLGTDQVQINEIQITAGSKVFTHRLDAPHGGSAPTVAGLLPPRPSSQVAPQEEAEVGAMYRAHALNWGSGTVLGLKKHDFAKAKGSVTWETFTDLVTGCPAEQGLWEEALQKGEQAWEPDEVSKTVVDQIVEEDRALGRRLVQVKSLAVVLTMKVVVAPDGQLLVKRKARFVERDLLSQRDGEMETEAGGSGPGEAVFLAIMTHKLNTKEWVARITDYTDAYMNVSPEIVAMVRQGRTVFLRPPAGRTNHGTLWASEKCGWGDGQAARCLYLQELKDLLECSWTVHPLVPGWAMLRDDQGKLVAMMRWHGDDHLVCGEVQYLDALAEQWGKRFPLTTKNIEEGVPWRLLGRDYVLKNNLLYKWIQCPQELIPEGLTSPLIRKKALASIRSTWAWPAGISPWVQTLQAGLPSVVDAEDDEAWPKKVAQFNFYARQFQRAGPVYQVIHPVDVTKPVTLTGFADCNDISQLAVGTDAKARKGLLCVLEQNGKATVIAHKSIKETRRLRHISSGEMYAMEDLVDQIALQLDIWAGLVPMGKVPSVTLYGDNQCVIQLLNREFSIPDGTPKGRSCLYIREGKKLGLWTEMRHISGALNPADAFTKSPLKQAPGGFIALLGLLLGLGMEIFGELARCKETAEMWDVIRKMAAP